VIRAVEAAIDDIKQGVAVNQRLLENKMTMRMVKYEFT